MGINGFIEGGISAVVAGCVTHPLDLIKVRMQLDGEALSQSAARFAEQAVEKSSKSPRVISMGLKILQKEGVAALFAGVSATAMRHALYSTTRLGLYELLKEHWSEPGEGLPVVKKVVAGLIAGAVGALVGNPADVAMVRMQADGRLPLLARRNYASVGDAIMKIVKTEGVGTLWRGSLPTVQRAMVVTAATLASYDQVKEFLIANKVMEEGVGTHLVASCVAGVVAALASNPIDVVKTRLMNMSVRPGALPPYRGALDCAFKTLQAEGPLALYKGFVPTVARQAPFTILLFLTLEQMRRLTAIRGVPLSHN